MTISLDFDGTYTADPDLWDMFVRKALENGHKVILCTQRTDTDDWGRPVRERLRHLTDGDGPRMQLVFAGNEWKVDAAAAAGHDVDIWIDDMPGVIGPALYAFHPWELEGMTPDEIREVAAEDCRLHRLSLIERKAIEEMDAEDCGDRGGSR